MKTRFLLSLLFIIATTFSALHELEHVHAHDSSTCMVCVVDDHTSSYDVIDGFFHETVYLDHEIKKRQRVLEFHSKLFSNQANAPPIFL